MVIGNLNVYRVTIYPFKTYPPLLVDADTPLIDPVTCNQFQTVTGWYFQFPDSVRGINKLELPPRYYLYVVR
jgi:hypothetical protein